jgi:hypothetical protein
MAGVSSGYSVSALSGRCPRIALPDLAASPFPATPLRTVPAVLPHTALPRIVAHRRGRTPSEARSPLPGWISLAGTHPAVLLSVCDPATGPSLARSSVVSRLPSVLCPAPTPSGPGPSATSAAPTLTGPGGSLQFPNGRSLPSTASTPEGSWRLPFPVLHRFPGLRRLEPGSAPSAPLPRRGCRTTRQPALLAADCMVARLPEEGFVSGLRRGALAPFSIRRRSATRRLDPYRDRTYTGKPLGAYLDAPRARHSGKLRGPWLVWLPGSCPLPTCEDDSWGLIAN